MTVNRLAAGVAATIMLTAGIAQAADVEVAKTPTCGCCSAWIDHLRDNGFEVTAYDVSAEQLNAIKAGLDLDPALTSCHTAMVEGFFIEGHVPASDIRALLDESPANTRGLTVPGMPIGSPGMEMGDRKDAYETLLVDGNGETSIYRRHHQ